MLFDLKTVRDSYRRLRLKRRPAQVGEARRSLFAYDFLNARSLEGDFRALVDRIPTGAEPAMVLDLGSGLSPYRAILAERRFAVTTLDADSDARPDIRATVESTGLPGASANIVLCTQVLEHVEDPRAAVREANRILKPGGHAILSAPHVWFYHPHPIDCWRFTPEGMAALCASAGLEVVEMRAAPGALGSFCQIAAFLAFGALGRWGVPIYFLLNAAGLAFDALVRAPYFFLNVSCLARKPERA